MRDASLIAQGVLAGARRSIARAITLADGDAPAATVIAELLRTHLGRATTIGVTGAPGAGKSTLVNALIGEMRKRRKRVAVIAVDPSSPISGGAVLGDRVRMAAGDSDDGVFIRSLATRGQLGGVSRSTARAVDVLDAAGYDVIVIETVGAGQSEVEIANLARTCVVVLPPGLGDEVQALKAGILEIADVLVVNKADLPDAARTERDLKAMLALRAKDRRGVPVLRTIATSGQGVAELADAIEQHARGQRTAGATPGGRASCALAVNQPASIEFIREIKQANILDPRNGFAPTAIESEVRLDPLTGATSRICHLSLNASAPADLATILELSRPQCPFCEESVARVTPRYPDDLIPGGRLSRGEAVLFPNLFPYDDFSAVAVISRTHYEPMEAMPARKLADALLLARDFLLHVAATVAAPHEHYGIVTWNFMPPAGASQVHPHLQIVFTRHPGNALRRELHASGQYRARHGRTFAADLVERECDGPRWIGGLGRTAWFTPFAPIGVLGDCCAVFRERATLATLSDSDIEDFCDGLVRVLRGFAARGLWSFNLTLLPDAEQAGADRHWLTARLLPRMYLNPRLHVSDVAYLQLLLDERFAMVYPEQTADHLRNAFAA